MEVDALAESLRSPMDAQSLRKSLESATVPVLKKVCKIFKITFSNKRKQELVDALLGYAATQAGRPGYEAQFCQSKPSVLTEEVEADLQHLPTFESCTSWKREVLVKNMNYDHIFQYLIEMRTKSADDRRRNSYKSLKGYDYFKCGWVVNVWMASPDETLPNYVFVRAHVYQSYPSRSKSPYSVFACLSQQGNVFKGKCGCVAGLGESCSHVAALLFFTLDCVENSCKEIPAGTCTDQLMSWHKPPAHMTVSAVRVTETEFSASQYGKTTTRSVSGGSRVGFDPRAPGDINLNPEHLQGFLDKMAMCSPSSGVFHFWDHPSLGKRKATYEADCQVQHLLIPEQPVSKDMEDIDDKLLAALAEEFMESCSIDASIAQHLEASTKKQSKSDLWRRARIGQLTSSVFHDVLTWRESTPSASIVSQVMGYTRVPQTDAMKWGIEHEKDAVADYLKHINAGRDVSKYMTHEPAGLTLHQEFSYLGASSDGLLLDPIVDNPHGVIEVKCPVSVSGQSVNHLPPEEIASKFGSKFYLRKGEEGRLCLSRKHRYYTQIQGELAVMNKDWADFVVWTKSPFPGNIFVERIYCDLDFWQVQVLPKLQSFYLCKVVPEIISRKLYLERRKPSTNLPNQPTSSGTSPVTAASDNSAATAVALGVLPTSSVSATPLHMESQCSVSHMASLVPASSLLAESQHSVPGVTSSVAATATPLHTECFQSVTHATSSVLTSPHYTESQPSVSHPWSESLVSSAIVSPSLSMSSHGLLSQASVMLHCCNPQCKFNELKPKPCRNTGCSHVFHHLCSTDDMGNYCSHCYTEDL